MNNKYFLAFIFLIFSVLNAKAATETVSSSIDRDWIIEKEMDCLAQHMNQKEGPSWGDHCFPSNAVVPESPRETASTVKSQTPEPKKEKKSRNEKKSTDVSKSSSNTTSNYINDTKEWMIQVSQKPEGFHSRTNTFSIDKELFYYGFRKPGISKYTGIWNGWSGEYVFRPSEENFFYNPFINFFSLEGIYAKGRHNYTGGASAQDNFGNNIIVPFKTKGIVGSMYEARILVGKDFYSGLRTRITPYTGWGMRNKVDKSGGILTDVTYNRQEYLFPQVDTSTTYYYIPLGLTTEFQTAHGFDMTFNLEYDFLYKGIAKYHNTDVNSLTTDPMYISNFVPFTTNDDVNLKQRSGFGVRTSIKFIKHYSLIDFYIEPYIRYWQIKQSKSALGIYEGVEAASTEPKNNTVEMGSKAGVQF